MDDDGKESDDNKYTLQTHAERSAKRAYVRETLYIHIKTEFEPAWMGGGTQKHRAGT